MSARSVWERCAGGGPGGRRRPGRRRGRCASCGRAGQRRRSTRLVIAVPRASVVRRPAWCRFRRMRESRGYDGGKKINGRKRFIVTDTLGLLLTVVVLTAGVQDRDGAKPVLLDTRLRTRVRFVFADGGFAGRLLDWAQTILATTLHIVRKPAGQQGFAVIPRRWAVERTFAWLTAHRRLARDYERDPAVSEAMIRWAAINTITRRIARGGPATRQQRRTFPANQLIFSNTL